VLRAGLRASATSRASDVTCLGFIPADPKDPRLKVAGAVCGADGKVDIEAYEDIMQCWAGEPPPEAHPDSNHPGVRAGEGIPQGLHIWDDVRAGKGGSSAGWVAAKDKPGPRGNVIKMNKRFNIRTCGSWRLAFLLARLQHHIWEHGDLPVSRVPLHLIGSPAKGSPAKRLLRRRSSGESQGKSPGKSSPTKRLIRRQSSGSQGSPRKRLRRTTSDGKDESAEKAGRPLKRQRSDENGTKSGEKLWPGAGGSSGKLSSVLDRIRARVALSEESK